MTDTKKNIFLFLLFSSVALFAIFPRLGSLPLREWDESRQAASAYEMYESGNYLVATFDHKPDLWNTKPPLLLWLQVLSMKICGVGVTAVRLPSALAMFFSSLALFWFCVKLKRPLAGLISALVFVCSKGLLFYHCGRSGDYDALMIMFVILYCGFFYLHTRLQKNKYLILFFLFLSLATLTKGIQALIPLAGIFLFVLFTKNLVPLLRNRNTYIGLLLFVILVGGFYVARESLAPGYLEAVWHNEAGGRFLTVIEEHSGGFWYYWDFIRDIQFPAFVWLLPVCFVINMLFKNKEARLANLYLGLLAVFYFIAISVSKTKLEWYSLPLIPFFALIIGLALSQIYFFVSEKWILISAKRNKDSKNSIFVLKTLMLAIILSLFYNPYSEIVKHNLAAKEDENNVAYYSRVNLMKMIADKESQNRYKEICYIIEEQAQLDFFYHYYMKENGVRVLRKTFADLNPGDYVQVNRPETLEKIQQHYETEETDFLVQSRILLLKSEKQENDGLISDNTEL